MSKHKSLKKYLKTISSRKIRRNKIYLENDDRNLPANGNITHKQYDYWWILY
jgi:hypothetical protein